MASHAMSELAKVTRSRSKQVQAALESRREHAEKILAEREYQAQLMAERTAEREERDSRIVAARLPRANKGLRRILDLGTNTDIQKLIELRSSERSNPEIGFYTAERPSGDDWEADYDEIRYGGRRYISLSFTKHYLTIVCAFTGEAVSWKVPYVLGKTKEAVIEDSPNKAEKIITVDDFLERVASPETYNMALVSNFHQRSLEWQPYTAVFQLLVSCARKERFENYLLQCVKNM